MKERHLTIQGTRIDDDSKCYVIAELGNNGQGDVEKTLDLIRAAKMAGVQAVKLQKRDNKNLFTKAAYDKPYENENSFGKTYGEHREFLEFGKKEYLEFQQLAKELNLHFFATAFDHASADFLEDIDLPLYKIASADLKNLPLLKHVAGFKKPLIISTGGGSLDDVRRVYEEIAPINPQLCFLQCTATYPTEAKDMHLRVLPTLREAFPDVVIGLSDHFNGISLTVAAYVLGARVIEKHFTLNHTWKGTDHALSLEPIGMHKMVRDLERAREALGSAEKQVLPQEIPAITKMGKSLFAARDLPVGTVITREHVAIKVPAGGLPPYEIDSLIGKTTKTSLVEDDFFTADNVA